MKTKESRRLPGYDSRSGRLESAAFAALGLAAAGLIAAGLMDSLRFSQGHQAAVEAWAAGRPVAADLARNGPGRARTSATGVGAVPRGKPGDTAVAPQVSAGREVAVDNVAKPWNIQAEDTLARLSDPAGHWI